MVNCNISAEILGLLNDIGIDIKICYLGRMIELHLKKVESLASQQQVIRFDKEGTNEISNKSQKEILKTLQSIIKKL